MQLFAKQAGFSTVVNLVAGLVIAIGLGVALFLVQQRTNILPFAQQNNGGACQAPAAPTNVAISYPHCQ
jgi:hypothetical protein